MAERRVTVIVPAYNAAEHLTTTLASIAGQTRPADEVVIIDDGSTDDTVAVARRWESMLPLRVVELEENIGKGRGAGGARAAGIAESTGDVLALLDADDLMLPSHLETMLRHHEQHGGLITANHLIWAPGEALGREPVSELIPVPPPSQQRAMLFSENFVFVATVFTRELYEKAGGFRNIRCEDWDLWIRMVEAGATITMPDLPTALYRVSEGSVSAGARLLVGDIDLLTELRERVHGDERDIVDAALQRRHATKHYLDGIEAYEAGRGLEARRAWVRAIGADHSLRKNNSQLAGSVLVRSLALLVAPGPMLRRREQRQGSAQRAVGNAD